MKKNYYFEVRGVRAAGGTRMYEITDYDEVGYLNAEDYARRPADAIADLVSQYGMFFSGGKRTRLVQLISEIEEFEDAHLFERVGHNGQHFVYPDGTVFSPPDVPPANVIFPIKVEKCHESGTLTGWLDEVAAPLAGNRVCEFFLMIPFAGPLRGYTTRVENFGWELTGPPASAKSVLLQLMASACGGSLGGDQGNYALSFAATSAGIEQETQNYSDLTMIIDEGNLYELSATRSARGRAFSQLLIALGKGQEKRRYGATSRTFRFVFATASNETLKEIIGGTSAASVEQAVADRLTTIPLTGREFGVFDRIPEGYSDIGDFIADVVNASSRHHGKATRHFLQGLVNLCAVNPALFRGRLEQHISDFRAHARVEANAGSARRVADNFGLIYAAARLAIYLGALPSTFDPLASTLACYRLHQAAFRPEPSAAEILRNLADDPDLIDLDKTALLRMSDKKLARTKGFLRTNRFGAREILIPPAYVRRLIPNWNQVRRDDFDVSRLVRRDTDGRHTVKRRVRRNNPGDRVIDLPPSEWSKISVILDREGDWECHRKSTRRRRSSASCARRRSCWRRVRRLLRRVGGSRSASRPFIVGARNMVA